MIFIEISNRRTISSCFYNKIIAKEETYSSIRGKVNKETLSFARKEIAMKCGDTRRRCDMTVLVAKYSADWIKIRNTIGLILLSNKLLLSIQNAQTLMKMISSLPNIFFLFEEIIIY